MFAKRASVTFALVTVFIDVLGVGLVIPILPRLVQSLLGGDVAGASLVYGLLLSIYAVMQFVCAPLLGALSDRFGRRPVILLALSGLAFDYILLSLAPTVGWLALGRLISGMFGATYAPRCTSLTLVHRKRAANFGLIGVAFGLGFIAGPGAGGPARPVKSALALHRLRRPHVPQCALRPFCHAGFAEPENRRAIDWSQANPLGALRAVWRYGAVAALVPVYVASSLAQQGLQSVWVPYTTYRYGWSVADVGISLAIVGLLFAISQGALVRPMVARFGSCALWFSRWWSRLSACSCSGWPARDG